MGFFIMGTMAFKLYGLNDLITLAQFVFIDPGLM